MSKSSRTIFENHKFDHQSLYRANEFHADALESSSAIPEVWSQHAQHLCPRSMGRHDNTRDPGIPPSRKR